MNKKVMLNIHEVVTEWITGERNYAFETRGVRYITKIPNSPEFLIVFFLKVDGFFENSNIYQPINLEYTSQRFITQTLSDDNPDNLKGDANYLKSLLESFTQECYDKIVEELKKYPQSLTSDSLYWE